MQIYYNEYKVVKSMDIISKVHQCIDYQSLYALEEDFNKVGLTIQSTSNGRVILCRIEDNKPCATKIVEDYIFVGSLSESTKELSDRATNKIADFINNNKSVQSEVKDIARVWRNGVRMYGDTIRIVNEDVEFIADNMLLG